MKNSIWIGWDAREAAAYAVARYSIKRRLVRPIPVRALILDSLRARGLYTRPTSRRDGQLWDNISDAPMATEFAISRFLVPYLANEGLALFLDCDMLVRVNIAELFDSIDPKYAVSVVKHRHEPPPGLKMDGQMQTRYARKNWSSVMVFNVEHPANKALTVEMVNSLPGRDLHRFCWLQDSEIGELGPEWNFLVGHTDPLVEPKIVHYTEGGPWFGEGFEDVLYGDEWSAELSRWAAV